MVMKLRDSDNAPNSTRNRIVIAAKGLEDQFEYKKVRITKAEHKQPDFLAINPIGKIPLLELEDGTFISESTAIAMYLDNLDGAPILTGKTPMEKATVHMMQRRIEQLVLEPTDDYFHYGTYGLGKRLREHRTDWVHQHEWALLRGTKAEDGLKYAESVLKTRPYLSGEFFSIADITLFISLGFMDICGLKIDPSLTAISRWRAHVESLPAVKNRSGQTYLTDDLASLPAAEPEIEHRTAML